MVEGLLRESNSETILLRGQNGKETLLNRSKIAELKSTGVSMMPEGDPRTSLDTANGRLASSPSRTGDTTEPRFQPRRP